MSGKTQQLYVENYKREEICEWIGHLRNRSGEDFIRLRKQQHTDTPSIQGIWTPFTNKPTRLNVTEFPSEVESVIDDTETDATVKLLEMARRLRLQNVVVDSGVETKQDGTS